MKGIRVQYSVRPEFAETNAANIDAVMKELRALARTDVRYSAWLGDDGKTFTHFVMFDNEEAKGVLPELEAFKTFQAELRGSDPEVGPQATPLEGVGASWDIFA